MHYKKIDMDCSISEIASHFFCHSVLNKNLEPCVMHHMCNENPMSLSKNKGRNISVHQECLFSCNAAISWKQWLMIASLCTKMNLNGIV